jgi:hypothetical protein
MSLSCLPFCRQLSFLDQNIVILALIDDNAFYCIQMDVDKNIMSVVIFGAVNAYRYREESSVNITPGACTIKLLLL